MAVHCYDDSTINIVVAISVPINREYTKLSWCPMDSCTRGSGRRCSSWPRGQAWKQTNTASCSNGLHRRLGNPYLASERRHWWQVSQRPSVASSQSLHWQWAHSSALATWLDKRPVCNGGSAVHWPLLAAYLHCIGRRDSATCNGAEETAEHLVFQCTAHDQAQRQTWPDQRLSTHPRRLPSFLEKTGAMTRPLTGNERHGEIQRVN